MIEEIVDIPGIKRNVPLAERTTWKIGGRAEYFWEAKRELLPQVLRLCSKNNISTYILGRGSNVLIDDEGLNGLVISTKENLNNIELKDEKIIAEAGVPMPALSRFAANQGLGRYEFLIGIPGTVGAGIAINAGLAAKGRQEIREILREATLITPDGKDIVEPAEDLGLSFRTSNIPERHLFVLSGTFEVGEKRDKEKIIQEAARILEERKGKQPLQQPTAGSVFKNPLDGRSAGWYLDEAGLKGTQVGGAKVSEKHANWIVNVGQALSSDVLELVDQMKTRVREQFDIELEEEIKYMK